MNNKLIPIVIILVALIIGGAVIYVNNSKRESPGESGAEVLPSQEVAERTMNFINENILRGQVTASLVEISEENGLYKIKFAIEGQEIESYATTDGKLFFPEGIDLSEVQPAAVGTSYTIGNFSVSEDEVCKEGDKPIVYFFGSESCPYCEWEHPIIEGVAEKFGGQIAFHNNMDSQDDMDVFQKYSTGGIPTLVLGCKYYRVGAGQQAGEEGEAENLTALICKLTDGQPAAVCSQVEDLINQVE